MDYEQSGLRADEIKTGTPIVEGFVPYIVFESAQTRLERTIKRLVIALIMTILFLFLSNAYWVYEWSQYEYEDFYYDQSGGGLNSINWGTQGDLINEPAYFDPSAETQKTDK